MTDRIEVEKVLVRVCNEHGYAPPMAVIKDMAKALAGTQTDDGSHVDLARDLVQRDLLDPHTAAGRRALADMVPWPTQTDDGAVSTDADASGRALPAPSSPDRINEWARVLMAAWAKAEPDHPVTLYPASYVATFADMARALDAYDREHGIVRTADYLVRGGPVVIDTARIEADLRERIVSTDVLSHVCVACGAAGQFLHIECRTAATLADRITRGGQS